jgi:glycine/D-amino acid oxidase-like deaminating enzyme
VNIDYLIVGQGLAGSLLAYELMQRNCRVVVVDNAKESASKVAAGLINPVTGMRLVKSPTVDELLPVAKQTYSGLEQFFQQGFYIEKPMYRVLKNEQELNLVNKRLQDPGYHDYLGRLEAYKPLIPFTTPFGYVQQKHTAYLLTRPLLACLRAFFIANNSYQKTQLHYQDIGLTSCCYWQGLTIKRVIFCEGYLAIHNPFFNYLPFQVVKGEILDLRHNLPLPDAIINFAHWLIPLSAHELRLGASFDRDNINTDITDFAKQHLLNSLADYYPALVKASLLQHVAHVRPCTQDRQPFLGYHPNFCQLGIFNGFGAKGSLQIPLLARQFADSLINSTPIDPAYDINRYPM